MKNRSFVVLLSCLVSLVAQAKENSPLTYRFVEVSSIKENSGLPPQIDMLLEISCNEELAQVIRYEKTDPKTSKTTIAVGALVQENPSIKCPGEKKQLTVDAGTTFSGREYEFVRIKK